MISRAEVGALRDAHVAADRDRDKVIDPDIFANPSVVADDEVPRVFHLNAGFDLDTMANLGAKGTEKDAAEAGEWVQVRPQNWQAEEKPD